MSKRLIKVANELNVATSTIVEHLASKGFNIENKPTAKLTPQMENIMREAFAKVLQDKKKEDRLEFNTRPTSVPPPPPPPVRNRTLPPPPPVKSTDVPPPPVRNRPLPPPPPVKSTDVPKPYPPAQPNKIPGLKVLGKIDLEASRKKAYPPALDRPIPLPPVNSTAVPTPPPPARDPALPAPAPVKPTNVPPPPPPSVTNRPLPPPPPPAEPALVGLKVLGKIDLEASRKKAQTRPLTPEETAEEKIEEQLNENKKIINLSGLGLEKFPDRLKTINQVKEINLSNNRIKAIPEWDLDNTSLTNLNLSNNEVAQANLSSPYFAELTNINLSKNLLKKVPVGLQNCKKLSNLNLDDNEIEEIRVHDLSSSPITHLSLSSNKILTLTPSDLPKNLINLNISRNKISYFDQAILEAPKLEDIRLFGNSIENVPVVIWDKKENRLDSLKDYFLSTIEDDSTYQLFEAKLVLVGNGGVGKSSLLHTLIASDTDIKKLSSTEGIDIVKWPLNVKNISNAKINTDIVDLNIWDFGGQEIYRSTHQFFLTKSSIYIFVWDARVEEDYISFSYWLSIIKILSSGSPTIVVMNKADVRQKQIDEVSLSNRFDNIVTYHKVSCTSKLGIKDLIEIIKDCVTKLDHIGNRWSKKRVHLKTIIEQLEEDTKPYDDFEDLCIKMGLSPEEVSHFSEQLHDLGSIIHYKDNEILQDIIILDPEWATDGVYRVLDNDKAKKQKGKLSYEDFKDVWKKSKRHRGKYITLIALMKEFSLCFYSKIDKVYIVPHLLSAEKPEYLKLQKENTYEITYNYDFLPAGIIESFICDNHNMIKNDSYWKYGACLEFSKKCRAEVITNPLDLNNKIVIRVSSALREEKNKALAIIENSLAKIHERFPSLIFKKSIKCNCKGDYQCHFNLNMIDDFERFNIRKIRCKQKENEYRLVPIDFIGGANLDNDIITTTQQLLSTDKIREALDKLKEFVLSHSDDVPTHFQNKIIALQGELSRIEDEYDSGSIEIKQNSLRRNSLINRAQSLIRQIERLET